MLPPPAMLSGASASWVQLRHSFRRHLVTKEQVPALMGVVSIDPNASKGLFATNSAFAPNHPGIKAAVPHRLELMNGPRLQALAELRPLAVVTVPAGVVVGTLVELS